MGSMTDVYGSLPFGLGRDQGRHIGRIILGASAVLFTISVISGTTEVFQGLGLTLYESRELSGICGGVAIPLAFSGVFLLLPATDAERQLAAIGSALGLIGVGLFSFAYPRHWNGFGMDLTFVVVSVYFIGLFTAFSAMFFAVSNVKIRKPGGVILKTVRKGAQNVLDKEDRQPVSQPQSPPQDSGVGFIGDLTSDPGDPQRMDDAEILGEEPDEPSRQIDEYCGNCTHFNYRRVGDELRPYCGLHDEMMDDLTACDEWTPSDD